MTDYIDRAAAITSPLWAEDLCPAAVLSRLPAADVAPVVHGKWKCLDGSQKHYCPVCGMDFDLYACVKKLFNYCPNCGAKTDLEESR